MSTKQITSAATQGFCDVSNAVAPPVAGCNAGAGIHILIPPDFVARVAAHQEVPGCTYSHLEQDGSLYVTDAVQAQLAIPAVVNALSPPLQTQAALLTTALQTAVVVTAQAEVIA